MNWINTTAILLAVGLGFVLCLFLDLREAESYRLQIDGPQGYKVQLEAVGKVVQAANSQNGK